ncbi:class I SAM-dependent methyltransferase [Actinomycetospora sp. OC33-EN08]|uniref:Class I SAM-dependent methyltransferase n=1 Tax=Actinomycetospora aurantiaca TaxID=3129233 RepID=A0ABU8MIT7_9PSEU
MGDVRQRLRNVRDSVLAFGVPQRGPRLVADAARVWSDDSSDSWAEDSHWRGGGRIDDDRFAAIGAEHLALFDRLAGTVGGRQHLGRVLEWGAGGGANAVAFAPRADEFVAVDVAAASLPECARQVRAVCDTPVVEILVDLAAPESALGTIPRPVDVAVCLYVLELVPTPAYGLRVLGVLADALAPDGLAFVQIKYDTGRLRTRSRRRNYRRNSANMTTYRLDEFWTAAGTVGLEPLAMTLVPENDLDERYAYLLLRRR